MCNLVYKIILMIGIYVILGCSIYIVRQIQVHQNKELTRLTALIFYIGWIVFLPVIIVCMYFDILQVDYVAHIEVKRIFKEFELYEGRKPTRSEKKEIRELLKGRISERDVENE